MEAVPQQQQQQHTLQLLHDAAHMLNDDHAHGSAATTADASTSHGVPAPIPPTPSAAATAAAVAAVAQLSSSNRASVGSNRSSISSVDLEASSSVNDVSPSNSKRSSQSSRGSLQDKLGASLSPQSPAFKLLFGVSGANIIQGNGGSKRSSCGQDGQSKQQDTRKKTVPPLPVPGNNTPPRAERSLGSDSNDYTAAMTFTTTSTITTSASKCKSEVLTPSLNQCDDGAMHQSEIAAAAASAAAVQDALIKDANSGAQSTTTSTVAAANGAQASSTAAASITSATVGRSTPVLKHCVSESKLRRDARLGYGVAPKTSSSSPTTSPLIGTRSRGSTDARLSNGPLNNGRGSGSSLKPDASLTLHVTGAPVVQRTVSTSSTDSTTAAALAQPRRRSVSTVPLESSQKAESFGCSVGLSTKTQRTQTLRSSRDLAKGMYGKLQSSSSVATVTGSSPAAAPNTMLLEMAGAIASNKGSTVVGSRPKTTSLPGSLTGASGPSRSYDAQVAAYTAACLDAAVAQLEASVSATVNGTDI